MTKQLQLKNHPDFKVDGKWVQKFCPEPYVVYSTRAGVLWTNLTQRCKRGGSLQKAFPAYEGVENGFEDFQEFAEWCQTQHGYTNKDEKGRFWQLDKDILEKGNRVYRPDLCVFIPPVLNRLLETSKRSRGECPIGVYASRNSFIGTVLRGVLGEPTLRKSFPTAEEAFFFYKEGKEAYIKQVADKYRGVIDDCVVEALYAYKVEITD